MISPSLACNGLRRFRLGPAPRKISQGSFDRQIVAPEGHRTCSKMSKRVFA